MIISRNFRKGILQEKIKTKSKLSGATKEDWQDIKEIEFALYDVDSVENNDTARYIKYTHLALTNCKNIKRSIHRISFNNKIFLVEDVKTGGRFTQLMLKEVDSNV